AEKPDGEGICCPFAILLVRTGPPESILHVSVLHWPPCHSFVVMALGGKLKVTQLSSTGYLGQFDFCAIARMGNAEDSHYCQVVESPSGSRKWYKYEHKTGCIASCVTLN
ncbi:hypothetical protein, partial [Escherichia coli]|uniref:hypothetical protein n=1 Tax=Escherichia coli TaxID=562 RepID=UPI001FCD2E18